MKKNDGIEMKNNIYNYMNSFVTRYGYAPSVREICENLAIKSTSTVHKYMKQLVDDGLIEKNPTKPRAIRILKISQPESHYNFQKEIVNAPILGKISAGMPILAIENIEDTMPLPLEFVKSENVFILTVTGDSMIEKSIIDGDQIIVRKQNSANNGDVVVALIGEEATVKTFYKEHGHVRLQPENKLFEPIIIKGNINILGKVIGLIRKI